MPPKFSAVETPSCVTVAVIVMRAPLSWRICNGACAWNRRLTAGGEEGRALTQRENAIRAAGPDGGAGVADSMCAAGPESLVQVICTELVDLRRVLEAATVRGGHRARNIRTVVFALNAMADGESDDDASKSDWLISHSSYRSPTITLASFSTTFFHTLLQYFSLLVLLVLHRVKIELSRC